MTLEIQDDRGNSLLYTKNSYLYSGLILRYVPAEWLLMFQSPETAVVLNRLICSDTAKELVSSVSTTGFLKQMSFNDDQEDTQDVKME
jgi:hypothetical protein